ncbi:MAG: hypothetical protein HY255_06645 [Betaproteobacteria bacterium]|nr:hypothetical protein [Betaproteobacteria bacterium]
MDTTFVLFAGKADAGKPKRKVYATVEDSWLDAVCVRDHKNQEVLLFQPLCYGSGCVELRLGVFDPRSMRLLIAPPEKNVPNYKAVEKRLGNKSWTLLDGKEKICCTQLHEIKYPEEAAKPGSTKKWFEYK